MGAVTFYPDGSQIATAGDDCVIRLWDRQTGAAGAVLDGHQERVSSMAYSPCGSWLVIASWSNTIRLWDLNDNNIEQPRTIAQIDEKHNAALYSMAISPTDHWVAVGCISSQVRLFDTRSGEPAMSTKLAKGFPRVLSFSLDGQKLAIGASNSSIYLWNVGWPEVVVVVEEEGFGTKLDGHRRNIFHCLFTLWQVDCFGQR